MPPSRRELLLKETRYGRSQGWDVELDGQAVALLDEDRWEDMFWVSYRVTPTTDDHELAARLVSEEFWQGDGWQPLRFRSRALGELAPNAFPSIVPFVEPGRLNMRGLYVIDSSEEPPAAPAGGLLRKLWRRLRGR